MCGYPYWLFRLITQPSRERRSRDTARHRRRRDPYPRTKMSVCNDYHEAMDVDMICGDDLKQDQDAHASPQGHSTAIGEPKHLPEPVIEDKSPVLFYDRHAPYFEFTNFSPHIVKWQGRRYPTSEHLFQAHKYIDQYPEHAERIRKMPRARDALQEAQRLRRLQRPDWFDVNVQIMEAILEAKFTQHPSLTRLLLGTGDRELIEDSPVDSFWGIGGDGQGRNELGKALMRLREKLRNDPVLGAADLSYDD